MQKKIIWGLIAAIVIVSILILFQSRKETYDKPTIKIGVSLPITGEAAYIGAPSRDSAMLALDKWKKVNTKYNYKLVVEDDQLSTKMSVTVANKMISIDKVKALVTIWDISSPIDMELAKRNNIIHMACTWGNGMSDGINNFNNVTSHKKHSEKMIKLLKQQKVKKVAYIAQVAKGDLDLKSTLIKDMKNNGIDVVFNEEVHIGDKDFRTLLTKMKNKKVDMIMITMIPEDFYAFVKQKKELGIDAPITTVDYFESIDKKDLVEGYYYVMSSSGGDKFLKEINTDVVGQCIGNVYDNVDLLIYAFEHADAKPGEIPTTEEVAKVLKKIKNYPGIVGQLSVDQNGHIDSPAYIKQIKNGKPELIKEQDEKKK